MNKQPPEWEVLKYPFCDQEIALWDTREGSSSFQVTLGLTDQQIMIVGLSYISVKRARDELFLIIWIWACF